MSDQSPRPWDLYLEKERKFLEIHTKVEETPLVIEGPEPFHTLLEEQEQEKPRQVRPWDLLNPNKERVPEEIQEQRLDICKDCPRLRKKLMQCKECGCIMTAKVKLAEAFCPLGKWSALEV